MKKMLQQSVEWSARVLIRFSSIKDLDTTLPIYAIRTDYPPSQHPFISPGVQQNASPYPSSCLQYDPPPGYLDISTILGTSQLNGSNLRISTNSSHTSQPPNIYSTHTQPDGHNHIDKKYTGQSQNNHPRKTSLNNILCSSRNRRLDRNMRMVCLIR